MHCKHTKLRRRTRPSLEALEDRRVPATFGVPWQDASQLTLSFVPDGATIAGHQSNLFSTLNAQEPTVVWEKQILQAFQTWAVNANINFGVRPDGGQSLGAPGQAQGDSRFGDIRVGAQQMAASALSISVPHDPFFSGTWSGDVLLNSNDAVGSGGPGSGKLDLYAVMLHEVGHVLGFDDGTNIQSPMYPKYEGNQNLTSGDIAALQTLYGVRAPDSHEGSSGNGTFQTASQISPPSSYNGTTPLIAYGDITTNSDIDIYKFNPASNYNGPVTIRLQTAGISLLEPKLSVYDASGRLLGQAQSTTISGDFVTLKLPAVVPGANYYVRVEGATRDVFGIGSYGLAVAYDATLQTSWTTIDKVLREGLQTVSALDLNSALSKPDTSLIADNEIGGTEGPAVTLAPLAGYAKNAHYTTVGSLDTAQGVDLYRITTADPVQGLPTVMTVTVTALPINGVPAQVSVLDKDLNPVPAQVLVHGRGIYTIEVPNALGSSHYYLQVTADPTSTITAGNYRLTADFGHVPKQPTTFVSGNLGAATTQSSYNLYIAQNQLFQFLLSAQGTGAPAGTAVSTTITDSVGNTIFQLTSPIGQPVSGDALLLVPGTYHVKFVVQVPAGSPVPNVSFQLTGSDISDPIGPAVADTTLTPMFIDPTDPTVFIYPNDVTSSSPFMFAAF